MYIDGIDDIDNKLLTLLKENARATYSELATEVGLSRVAVKNRIEVMEEIGLIRGYEVKVAPKMVDNSIEFIMIVEPRPEHFDYVLKVLSNSKFTTKVQTTGGANIYAFGVVPSPAKLDEYYKKARKIFTDVRYFSFNVITSTYKDIERGIEYVDGKDESAGDPPGADN